MIARLRSVRTSFLAIDGRTGGRQLVVGGTARCFGSGRSSPPTGKQETSTCRSRSNSRREKMMKITNNIVNKLELGALSTQWKDGEDALEFWTTQQSKLTTQQQEDQEQSRLLLERMLQERKHLMSRLERVHGGGESGNAATTTNMLDAATTMLEHCYSLDSTEMIRRIVARQVEQQRREEGTGDEITKNKEKKDLALWVEDIVERFDVKPSEEVFAFLEMDTHRVPEEHPVTVDSGGEESDQTSELLLSENPQHSNVNTDIPAQPQRVLRSMDETEDNKLEGSTLLEFVRTCDAAGINLDETRKRVDEYIKSRHNNNMSHVSRSKQAYAFVLQSWKELAPGYQIASKEGDRIIYEMLQTHLDQKNLDLRPSRRCFSTVIAIHSIRGDAEAAERVLQDMLHLYRETGDEDYLPDRQCFVRVLLILFQWTLRRDKRVTHIADKVLGQMLDLAAAKQDSSLLPPQSVFQHMLTLWSMSYENDSGERADAILLRQQELRGEIINDNNLPPVKFFELAMQCWANSHVGKRGALRVEKLHAILKQNVDTANSNNNVALPESFGLLQAMQAFSRATDSSREAIQKVEAYFKQFRRHFGSEEVSSLDIVLAYRARIAAWDLCADVAIGASKSQAAFDDLLFLKQRGIVTVDLNVRLYAAVANAWAKAGNAEQVKTILKQMADETGQTPNTRMYNSLLLALARSKEQNAAEQAEELLSELERMSKEGDKRVQPNSRSYGTVVLALSNSPDPAIAARAELYLDRLKQTYEASGDNDGNKDEDLKPDTWIYTSTILSLAKQRSKEAVEKAQRLLDEMHVLAREGDGHVRPNKGTYAAFLKLLREADIPNKEQMRRDTLSLMQENGIEPESYILKYKRR